MDAPGQRPDDRDDSPVPYVFPAWVNQIPRIIPVATAIVGAGVIFSFWFWASPKNTEVGYAPVQPVPYSHKLHAGDYGIDCRYCHTAVEKGPKASVPSADICMNCHTVVKHDSPLLQPVRDSYAKGTPIEWIKVHKIADFAYFSHAQHVNKGVGCVECHGRVDQMETVRVEQPLSMSWCLDCHRNPGPHLRPKDQVTNMSWQPEGDREKLGAELVEKYHVNAPEDCSGCHR